MFHGFLASDLADQNHIGRLPQGVFQCVFVSERIDADFPLINQRLFMRMDIFDGIFNSDNVTGAVGIAMID